MADTVCPGQNTLFWKPEDIFEVSCPVCGASVEFFKDDVSRKCQIVRVQVPEPAPGHGVHGVVSLCGQVRRRHRRRPAGRVRGAGGWGSGLMILRFLRGVRSENLRIYVI